MKIKHFLVIDDNEDDADHLINTLGKSLFFRPLGVVSTLEEAISRVALETVDLIFLDIHLANQSGLTLLKVNMPLPPVIITSAYPEYAIESYQLGKASDYLLKPFTTERLQLAITRAVKINIQPNSMIGSTSIFLKAGRKIQRFEYQSVDYVEAFGIYTKIYTDDQYTLTNERLSSIKKLLPDHIFVQVHKSYIVNVNKITTYDRNNFWIGKTKIPIGLSYRSQLEDLLSLFERDE